MATIRTLLKDAERRILASPQVDLWRRYMARLDADDLMRSALGDDFDDDDLDTEVLPLVRRRYERMVRRREDGEPVALIRGFIEFRGLELLVRRQVFTPRYSSESLATRRDPPRIGAPGAKWLGRCQPAARGGGAGGCQ